LPSKSRLAIRVCRAPSRAASTAPVAPLGC
jgi:hypothetical protein